MRGIPALTLCLLLSSANNVYQFEPRYDLTKCQISSGSKRFDTLMVFLKIILSRQVTHIKLPSMQRIESTNCKVNKLNTCDFVCGTMSQAKLYIIM